MMHGLWKPPLHYWHPNEGKTISSWAIDYSGRSLPIGEGCVTSPTGCSTSSDPVLAGLDVVSVPEYDPQDKSWSLVAQEVETTSGTPCDEWCAALLGTCISEHPGQAASTSAPI